LADRRGRARGSRPRLPRGAGWNHQRLEPSPRAGRLVIWLTWRQQRTETLVAALVLVLLAAVLVPTGLHMASVYDNAGLAGCVAHGGDGCGSAINNFDSRFEHLGGLIAWFNL